MTLFRGYEAFLTGAPKSLLLIIEYFKGNTDLPIEIIFGKDGPQNILKKYLNLIHNLIITQNYYGKY